MSKPLRYLTSMVVFQEIPDEITLSLNITNCPFKCEGCHSPELRENIGTELTVAKAIELVNKNPYITCLCFMGGDAQHEEIIKLSKELRGNFLNLKLAMYSGREEINPRLIPHLDYYKVGPWITEKGPLNSRTTNQKLYKIENGELVDITHKFWR